MGVLHYLWVLFSREILMLFSMVLLKNMPTTTIFFYVNFRNSTLIFVTNFTIKNIANLPLKNIVALCCTLPLLALKTLPFSFVEMLEDIVLLPLTV
jgi:hypothetical protein